MYVDFRNLRQLTLLLSLSLVLPSMASGQTSLGLEGFRGVEGLEGLQGSGGTEGNELKVSASFTSQGNGKGMLAVTAEIAPGWHVYSVTQKSGGPPPLKFILRPSREFKLAGDWQPEKPPKVHRVEYFDVPLEEHAGTVTWTAPVEFTEGVDLESLVMGGNLEGQICQDGGVCMLLSSLDTDFEAQFVDEPPPSALPAIPESDQEPFRVPGSHAAISGVLTPGAVSPGGNFDLFVTVTADDHWHVYPIKSEDVPDSFSMNTTFGLELPNGWSATNPVSLDKPTQGQLGLHHEGTVTWVMNINVPKEAKPANYAIRGEVGLQTCEQVCDPPTGVQFTVNLPVGASQPGQSSIAFVPSSYSASQQLNAATAFSGMASVSAQPDLVEQAPVESTAQALPPANVLVRYAGMAFLAGLILNVMPCVLPVIGLKVMSFINQAGESRLRILSLNLWFSLGLISVFMALASAAVFLNFGWGSHLQSATFNIVLACVVFVFALSFLGVWEIPIPGFVGTGSANELAAKEGASGAFFKGALTTVLATPCSGPMLGPAIGWAIVQPPAVTYLVFFCLGLGMASPFLVIGAFPAAVRFLPKPGAWMDTFKQIMGFVLMGTVVFIVQFLDLEHYGIAILSTLVGLGLACWFVGRTPLTAALPDRLKAWGGAVAIGAVISWLSFTFFASSFELDWEPFQRVALNEHLEKGEAVLIDFTADW